DAAFWSALRTATNRPLDRERTGMDAPGLRKRGSKSILHADNTKMAGLIAAILGVLGIGNSIAVGSQGDAKGELFRNANTDVSGLLAKIDALTKQKTITAADVNSLHDLITTFQGHLNTAVNNHDLIKNSDLFTVLLGNGTDQFLNGTLPLLANTFL